LITTPYNWSHPEHTVELTPDEAVELATLAGFHVTHVKGLWLCESPHTKKLCKFDEMGRFGTGSVSSRLQNAVDNPYQSFIWWIEARRSDRQPDSVAMARRMQEIWDVAWPQRCTRTLTIVGSEVDNGSHFQSHSEPGVLMYGPYLPIRKGVYDVELHLDMMWNSIWRL
jgi:hypothetical protein